jgi:hypothetical protein
MPDALTGSTRVDLLCVLCDSVVNAFDHLPGEFAVSMVRKDG